MFETVLRGRLVLETEVIDGEIGISNGTIVAISPVCGVLTGHEVRSFGASYIFPGFIDAHVHCFSNPNEGFMKATASAAIGGVTTIVDMPYDSPHPVTNLKIFEEKVRKLNQQSLVDVGLWATISKAQGTEQIVPLAEAGALAFKMSTFETDPQRFPRIPDPEILKAMDLIRRTGLRAGFHSENDDIIVDLIRDYEYRGKVYPRAHTETRPPVTETSAVLKLLEFAYWTGAKLHIVHVSHPRSIDLIQMFKLQGVDVTSETCYPYLLMDVDDLDEFGPMAKMNPPLRFKEDKEALWKKVSQKQIDMFTSDHAPWSVEQKEEGNKNIFRAASGLPGLETIVPLLFDATVGEGRLSPVEFAHFMATNPSKVFSIKNKGRIAIGYDADLTVIDPAQTVTIDKAKLQSCAKFTPFHGRTLGGKIVETIVRGSPVYDGQDIVVEPGHGKFVPGLAYRGVVEKSINFR